MAAQFIAEIDSFRKMSNSWDTFKKSAKTDADKLALYSEYLTFLDAVIDGVKNRLNSKKYNKDSVVQNIIKDNCKNKAEYKEVLRMNLYCIQDYCEGQKGVVKVEYIDRYEHIIYTLLAEIEWYFRRYDELINETNYLSGFGTRNNLHVFELYILCKNIQYIETVPKIQDFYFRDIRPTSIFLVRQILEESGKGLIGYSKILDKNKEPIKKFSQVAWDFLKSKNSSSWRLQSPFQLATIYGINCWANQFIHTTIFAPIFVQSYIIQYISPIINPDKTKVVGDKRALRSDFAQYLSNLHKSDLTILWANGEETTVEYKKPCLFKRLINWLKARWIKLKKLWKRNSL